MAQESKKMKMAGLCWISIIAIAILLLSSTILKTDAEVAAAESNEESLNESVNGGLPTGLTKGVSCCHKPGYPASPHCNIPCPAHAHRPRPILHV